MKKVVMLSVAAILGVSSVAVSQAEETTDSAEATEVVAETTQAADATETTDANATTDAEGADVAADESTEEAVAADADGTDVEGEVAEGEEQAAAEEQEPIPEDTPQVKKLIELYPNLVARIQPYGQVCFPEGDCDVTVTASAASAGGEPRDGEAVYNAVCHTCHATGLLNSPKLGDAGAWGPRIAKGIDTLHQHAIEGFNAMPAKGGADIPDEEVMNAVDYMVEQAS